MIMPAIEVVITASTRMIRKLTWMPGTFDANPETRMWMPSPPPTFEKKPEPK